MAQLTASGRDTAYVWVGRDTGGQPDPAAVLLRPLPALAPVDVEVAQWPAHGLTAERSTSIERTSLPVVVRGSWSSRCNARGRL